MITMPPPPSRSQAIASGETSSTITLMNMNDAPQMEAIAIKTAR